MPSAQQLRAQIEATLAKRIPSALTPLARTAKPVVSTGVADLDRLLQGGFPLGSITELAGNECSGRTSLALTFVAGRTQAGKVCAWVDVSDTLHPESAAALGVDLSLLLWTRCGVTASPPSENLIRAVNMQEKPVKVKPGLPQGGSGHPRMEAQGLAIAVSALLGQPAAGSTDSVHKPRTQPPSMPTQFPATPRQTFRHKKPWHRLDQALRVTDLLLQAGGFSCIVLDMGSLSAEQALRVPLATWFRFRAAAERMQLHLLLLTQHTCSKSSAGLVLRMEPGQVISGETTIFTGLAHKAALERQRFSQLSAQVLPIRKPPQSAHGAVWTNKAAWAGR